MYESGRGFNDIYSDGVNRQSPNHFHNGRSGTSYRTQDGFTYYQTDFDPFDLFAEMFGGSMFQQHHHRQRTQQYHRAGTRQRQNAQRGQGQQNSGATQVGPVLLMIIMWFGMMFFMGGGNGAGTQQNFSLEQTNAFRYRRLSNYKSGSTKT